MWRIICWAAGIVSGLLLVLVLSGWAYYESLDLEAEPGLGVSGGPRCAACWAACLR